MKIISDKDLKSFYQTLALKCDEADNEKDEFLAMGIMQEIETLIEGANATIPHERRDDSAVMKMLTCLSDTDILV
jgi:hypothetical protein